MPIYLYRCDAGHEVEMLRTMSDRNGRIACPSCSQADGVKVAERVSHHELQMRGRVQGSTRLEHMRITSGKRSSAWKGNG